MLVRAADVWASGEKIRLFDLKPVVCRVRESISFFIETKRLLIKSIDNAKISCLSDFCCKCATSIIVLTMASLRLGFGPSMVKSMLSPVLLLAETVILFDKLSTVLSLAALRIKNADSS